MSRGISIFDNLDNEKDPGMLSEPHSCCIWPEPFYPDLTFSEHTLKTLVVWEIQSRSAFSEMPRPACSCCHMSSFFFFDEEQLNICT